MAQAIRKTAPSERIVVTATGVPSSQSGLAASARAAPVDGEGDDTDAGSLLAGPRNVTPYIAKRGEQYMNAVQLEHFRNILNGWKRDLMEEVDRTVSHMKDEAANFPDPNDRATQEEEFSLELRTRDRERKLIRKIDEALKRVEDGSLRLLPRDRRRDRREAPRSAAGGHADHRSAGTPRASRTPVRRPGRSLPLSERLE